MASPLRFLAPVPSSRTCPDSYPRSAPSNVPLFTLSVCTNLMAQMWTFAGEPPLKLARLCWPQARPDRNSLPDCSLTTTFLRSGGSHCWRHPDAESAVVRYLQAPVGGFDRTAWRVIFAGWASRRRYSPAATFQTVLGRRLWRRAKETFALFWSAMLSPASPSVTKPKWRGSASLFLQLKNCWLDCRAIECLPLEGTG